MKTAFERAQKILPLCLCPDYVGQHKTVSDLRFLAQHELDLADEGDITLDAKDRKAILKFLMLTKEGA